MNHLIYSRKNCRPMDDTLSGRLIIANPRLPARFSAMPSKKTSGGHKMKFDKKKE